MRFNYKEVRLGMVELEYVRRFLSEGLSLSRILLEGIDLHKEGRLITFLPVSVNRKEAGRAASARAALQEDLELMLPQIASYMSSKRAALCLFEDAGSKPGDGCVAGENTGTYIYKDELYRFVNQKDLSLPHFADVMRKSAYYRFLGVIASNMPANCRDSRKRRIELGELRACAGNAEAIIVGGYDGEGCLVWERDPGDFRLHV